MSARTITGTLRLHLYAHHHRTRNETSFNTLLRDVVDPLPPDELWTIEVLDSDSRWKNDDGEPYRFYRMKSGRLPTCLNREQDGQEVTIRASVEDWSNGLGGYISRTKPAYREDRT